EWIEASELVEGTKFEKELKPLEEVAVRNVLKIAKEHAEFEPGELRELQTGEHRRRFNTLAELLQFVFVEGGNIYETNETIISLGLDGLYALDIVAKTSLEEVAHEAGLRLRRDSEEIAY